MAGSAGRNNWRVQKILQLAVKPRCRLWVTLRAIARGAVVDGPSILDADLVREIEYMEGLDVHRDADGEIVLTMISDDKFSLLQRTLLLQFTLVE